MGAAIIHGKLLTGDGAGVPCIPPELLPLAAGLVVRARLPSGTLPPALQLGAFFWLAIDQPPHACTSADVNYQVSLLALSLPAADFLIEFCSLFAWNSRAPEAAEESCARSRSEKAMRSRGCWA